MIEALGKWTNVGRMAALVAMLVALLPLLTAVADTAQARKWGADNAGQIVFASNRATGNGVNNPEADFEIYVMNPDGSEGQNLSNNADLSEFASAFAPDGKELAYSSFGRQPSNPEGDDEIYLMNADGSRQQNLTRTGRNVNDVTRDFASEKRN